jgi:methionyl-tRNA formyltransferase
MSPYPAAWTELVGASGNAVAIKIYEVAKEGAAHTYPCGKLLSDGKSYIKVAVEGGYINILSVQLAGKKRMPVGDLLRGFDISNFSAAE